MKSPNFLIVAALETESCGLFEKFGCPVLYTGIGKINATFSLTAFLLSRIGIWDTKPTIINIGTAGSYRIAERSIVSVSRFIQRDMLAMPLAPRYVTPFEENTESIEVELNPANLERVVCGSGDSFVDRETLYRTTDYDIVDMEGYALAYVCRQFKVPFTSIKYISDPGDADDWKDSLRRASQALSFVLQDRISDFAASKTSRF